MTFMKDYGFGAVGFTMLLTTLILQWALITLGFSNNFASNTSEQWESAIDVDIRQLLEALFAVAAVLISYGGVIGKVSPLQLSSSWL
jgi:ammonium transporter Rh